MDSLTGSLVCTVWPIFFRIFQMACLVKYDFLFIYIYSWNGSTSTRSDIPILNYVTFILFLM